MSRRNRHGFDDPAVILSGGPSHSRAADDDDPPYVPPRLALGFAPSPGGYLLSTPRDMPRGVLAEIRAEAERRPLAMPLLWDGDQA